MKLGVTVGKFYPYHLGHDYLIRAARQQVDHLVVILGYKPTQALSGQLRASWITQMHPEVEVILALEDIPNESQVWAERTLHLLGGRQPHVAFTSERYGEEWAALMGCQHVAIDPQRATFSISGTQLRQDLATHWAMLTPPAKAHFARRVCVLGVESSGTTTLAQALAQHYQTAWVPEYGRWYWEGRRYTPAAEDWQTYEFVSIARGQAQWEDDLALQANKILICDTDPLTTHVWHRRYVGHYAEQVEAIADTRHYDLYLLTEPDFGFVQDGTREGEHIRMEMHQWFMDVLDARQHPYLRMRGPHSQRLAEATAALDGLSQFTPLAAP